MVFISRSPGDVLETFNFLENTEDSDEDDDEEGDLMDDITTDKHHRAKKHKTKVNREQAAPFKSPLLFFSPVPPSFTLPSFNTSSLILNLCFVFCFFSLFPLLLFQVGNEGLASEDDADTEEALKEFDFLVTAEDGEGAGEARSSGDGTEWGKRCT